MTVISLLAVVVLGILAYFMRSVAIGALPSNAGIAVAAALNATANLSVSFVVLNVLPLPPLTGRYVLYGLLKPVASAVIERRGTIASLVVAGLIVSGLLQLLLTPVTRVATRLILGVH
ncbi:MAG: hypothetical protein KF813_07775 [Trueperaceae bacterium]|nr:hypothetical protein [Trueperaceae bacterium]